MFSTACATSHNMSNAQRRLYVRDNPYKIRDWGIPWINSESAWLSGSPRIGGERSSKQEGKRTDEQQHVEVEWLSLPSLR